MRNSHRLIVGAVAVIVIAAAWVMFPRKVGDDHESSQVQQERQTERQQSPLTSDEHRDPPRSSGAGSGSDPGRGDTGVPTGTAK
jgi:hypothetical protein